MQDEDLWLDVTVALPQAAGAINQDGAAAALAEKAKLRKYPGGRLVPCAVEAHGRFGESFLAYLRRLVRHSPKDEKQNHLTDIYKSIAAALHRGNALLVASAARP